MTRQRLPETRQSITHTFRITGKERQVKGYITVGLYPDGTPGELFLTLDHEGSETRGAWQAAAVVASLALQHGVPIETIANKLAYMRFEPAGPTDNPQIPLAASVADYIGRWLLLTFCQIQLSNTNNTTEKE